MFFFGNVTRMGPQAWQFVQDSSQQYDYLGFAETHVRTTAQFDEWRRSVRREGRRLLGTAARSHAADGRPGTEAPYLKAKEAVGVEA